MKINASGESTAIVGQQVTHERKSATARGANYAKCKCRVHDAELFSSDSHTPAAPAELSDGLKWTSDRLSLTWGQIVFCPNFWQSCHHLSVTRATLAVFPMAAVWGNRSALISRRATLLTAGTARVPKHFISRTNLSSRCCQLISRAASTSTEMRNIAIIAHVDHVSAQAFVTVFVETHE